MFVAVSLSEILYEKGGERLRLWYEVSWRCKGGKCMRVHLSKWVACYGIFPSIYPVIHVLVLLSLKDVCVDLSWTVRSRGNVFVMTSR